MQGHNGRDGPRQRRQRAQIEIAAVQIVQVQNIGQCLYEFKESARARKAEVFTAKKVIGRRATQQKVE